MSLRYALSPSGGIAYHLIAKRRAHTLWRPFRAVVRDWITSWLSLAQSDELIVFGPSAGWTLPLEDFRAFTRLTFVEPDPVARFLLRRRLRANGVELERVEFIARADLLPWASPTATSFTEFLAERPSAAILFANMLGQIPLHLDATQISRAQPARDEFQRALDGRVWASYHDLFSGTVAGLDAAPRLQFDHYRGDISPLASMVFAKGDVIDHEMAWLAGDQQTKLALWPLTEKSWHVIGFVSAPRLES